MPRYPNPKTGLLGPDDDAFRNLSGKFDHQRQHTLADDYKIGRAYLRYENGVVTYHPKGRNHTIGGRDGDQ